MSPTVSPLVTAALSSVASPVEVSVAPETLPFWLKMLPLMVLTLPLLVVMNPVVVEMWLPAVIVLPTVSPLVTAALLSVAAPALCSVLVAVSPATLAAPTDSVPRPTMLPELPSMIACAAPAELVTVIRPSAAVALGPPTVNWPLPSVVMLVMAVPAPPVVSCCAVTGEAISSAVAHAALTRTECREGVRLICAVLSRIIIDNIGKPLGVELNTFSIVSAPVENPALTPKTTATIHF